MKLKPTLECKNGKKTVDVFVETRIMPDESGAIAHTNKMKIIDYPTMTSRNMLDTVWSGLLDTEPTTKVNKL
jgi:hypothetical protein